MFLLDLWFYGICVDPNLVANNDIHVWNLHGFKNIRIWWQGVIVFEVIPVIQLQA